MNKFGDYFEKCNNLECACHKPKAFWIQLDEDYNPINVCWAYYDSDKPTVGNWIRVVESDKL